MDSIEAREAALYEDIWQNVEDYAVFSPGKKCVPMFLEMAGLVTGWDHVNQHVLSVLDAGCGSGQGAVALADKGFDVKMCDVTGAGLVPEAKVLHFSEACLWRDLKQQLGYAHGGRYDYVYCCDVLEHLPPEFTMLAIEQLLRVTKRSLFLSIGLLPDNFSQHMHIGKALHQSVFPFTWWRDRLKEIGRLVECRDLLASGVYLVAPR